MNEEIETKINEWLSLEAAAEHPADSLRFYEFIFECLRLREKLEQCVYEEKIHEFQRRNPRLTNEWAEKYNYSLYEELYNFGVYLSH